ncbi:MAG: hypothetical protein EXR71_01920 [Myxococcales bacterium]|nr:hypothetical protein [Myxococcales bacterium]
MRLLALLSLCLPAAYAATGGPDASGEVYTDSAEADGPSYAWLDTSGGTSLTLGDDTTAVLALPFAFSFYGTAYSTVTVSDNGVLYFDGASTTSVGSCPGASSTTSVGVAALWSDLGAGTLTYDTFGTYPYRSFVVSWVDVPHATYGGDATFQIWLLEGRDEVVLQYGDLTFGDAAVDGGVDAYAGTFATTDGLSTSCLTTIDAGTSVWLGNEAARPARAEIYADELDTPWSGADAFTYAGLAMAIGDINRDGDDEVLLGGPSLGAGSAWLLYGPRAGGTTLDLADATFEGVSSGDDFGTAVAMADMDGDGTAELAFGAPGFSSPATDSGVILIFEGSSFAGVNGASGADIGLGGSPSGRSSMGKALAFGDFNDDGYSDLLAGAPDADEVGSDSGAVYILDGSATISGSFLTGAASSRITGAASGDTFGSALVVGDLDADGRDDFAASSPGSDTGATNGGAVYTVLGADLPSGGTGIASVANCRTTLNQAQAKLGGSLAMANIGAGSGLDLIIGTPFYDTTYTDIGAVYQLNDMGTGCTTAATGASVIYIGATASGRFGGPVATGDVDGSGRKDLIVSATNDNTYSSGGGVAYAYTSPITSTTAVAGDAEHALFGTWSGGRGGSAVGVSDGNGGPSLVFTAAYADEGTTGTGALVEWPWHTDFEDDDSDGFVNSDGGGNDCDDDEPLAYPSGTETLGDSIDGDCDGWVDGVIAVRSKAVEWEWDVDQLSGTISTTLDFESGTAGDTLTSLGGVTFVGATYDERVDQTWPDGTLAISAPGSVTLTFDAAVDAISLQLLDASDDFTLQAYDTAGDPVVSAYDFELRIEGRPGGVFRGYTFVESIGIVVLSASGGDMFGIDNLQVVDAADTDRDLDGQTETDGDCDDTVDTTYTGADELLGNGVDDDCDGIVDGGALTVWSDSAAWETAADLSPEQIDFEDLTEVESIDTQYSALGATFDGTPQAAGGIDGTSATGTLAANANSTSLTVTFTEVQPAVALTLLDLDDTVTIEGYVAGTLLYTSSYVGTGGSEFVGLTTEYGFDELVLTVASDTFGIDDVIFSALGLDDSDGDGLTESEGDCDDTDDTISADATEVWYDGTDSDCDGADDYDQDGDGAALADDCSDTDDESYPGATDTWYDGIDSDCGGDSDYDQDGDGEDSAAGGGGDCDDTDAAISTSATEVWYDGVDSDCDGASDYDQDGDGVAFGSGSLDDCDDSDDSVSPDVVETYYDSIDNDCDGATVDDDQDGDGYTAVSAGGDDCEDANASAYPGASGEACYDGVDQDCDGANDYDCDGDGGISADYGGDDCDDADDTISVGAADVMGDGIDSDCDGGLEYDFDGDGYDRTLDGGEDCEDGDAGINPAAAEVCYDGIDQDCGGGSDDDCDGDGYDALSLGGNDCEDSDATINPGAMDFPYDGVDNDCDGASEYDIDGDGFTADWYGGTDCDDADGTVYLGAMDACYDGADTDCGGDDDYDCDADGYSADAYGGDDCDDADGTISPAAAEIEGDGIDQDCDGLDPAVCTDCDGDGFDGVFSGGSDCDDDDAEVFPGAVDVAYDGVDADCVGDSDYDRDGDGDAVPAGGGNDCDDADPVVASTNSVDDCGSGDEDCDGDLDEDCDTDNGGDTGDTDTGDTDTGDTDTGDTGDTDTDTDADWRPEAEEVRDAETIDRGTVCGCGSGSASAGVAGLLVAAGLRRRRGGRR